MTDWILAGASSSRSASFVFCRSSLRPNMAGSAFVASGYRKGVTRKGIRYAERINPPLMVLRVLARQAIPLRWGCAGRRRRRWQK